MFQFAFVAVLFQLRARGPVLVAPLLQLPKRRATAQGGVGFLPCYLIFFYVKLKLILSTGGIAALCLAPPDPLNGYAGRW